MTLIAPRTPIALSKDRGMFLEFPKERNENFLQERFAAAGELQSRASGKLCIRSSAVGNLQPEKIKKRKTDLQSGL